MNPPYEVKPAFNEVIQAIQEKERAIKEALADYNSAVPRPRARPSSRCAPPRATRSSV